MKNKINNPLAAIGFFTLFLMSLNAGATATGLTVLAQDRQEEGPLTLNDSSKTKYQVIFEAYQSVNAPAGVADFLNHSTKACVIISTDKQDEVEGINIAAECTKYKIQPEPAKDIPGTPARDIPAGPGPLFPAQHIDAAPEQHIPAVEGVCDPDAYVLVVGGNWVERATPKETACFSNHISPSDFIVSVSKDLYSGVGKNVRIKIRKSSASDQNVIFPFIVETSDKGVTHVGYCY